MENNKLKTTILINNQECEKEINELKIEVIPAPKIDNNKIDLNFKLIVIGNSNVGKSCLSLKGTTGKFDETYVANSSSDMGYMWSRRISFCSSKFFS